MSAQTPRPIVLDTNIFVAAAFKPSSKSAQIISAARGGVLRLMWDRATRGEIEHIVGKIPRISNRVLSGLFQEENELPVPEIPSELTIIEDPADRKFAALARSADAILITNDDHLLSCRETIDVVILRPGEFNSLPS